MECAEYFFELHPGELEEILAAEREYEAAGGPWTGVSFAVFCMFAGPQTAAGAWFMGQVRPRRTVFKAPSASVPRSDG